MRKYQTAWLAALPVLVQLGASPVAQASLADPLLVLDADDDGVVTTRELEVRAFERWRSTDLDHDGKVTAREMTTKLVEFRHERFAARDADGNGVLEQGELADVPEALVTKLDVDRSGALSQAELDNGFLRAAPDGTPKLLPGDTNNDGAIVKTEAAATARLLARTIDADGDGRLSAAELAQAPVLRTYGAQLLGL
jgi:EF hand